MLRKNCSPNSSNMALTSTPVGRRREVWKEGREVWKEGKEENERYGRRVGYARMSLEI